MTAIAHSLAISCYVGAAALAAAPFVRPTRAPRRAVLVALALGVAAHLVALFGVGRAAGAPPLTGLGPALSFAALVLAGTLLVAELVARDVSLTLLAAPLAAVVAIVGHVTGLEPIAGPAGMRGVWLVSHIALSFVGIGALATAAAAGAMYLAEHRELRSRRYARLFRVFPPLATLDRVNQVAAVAGWLGLTLGIVLAVTYSLAYGQLNVPQIVWGLAAWLGAGALAVGRLGGWWQARRAAVASGVVFTTVVVLYLAFRMTVGSAPGSFL